MASMEESKLIFSLDLHNEGPTVAFSKDKPSAGESRSDLSPGIHGHRSQASSLTHSPSFPGSLADLSASSAGMVLTTNLVKSSSTDLEPRESSSVRGKPLLSLVKSLSTEISRRVEPEVNLSKSDSKLHLHPWKQLTQPKTPGVGSDAGVLSQYDDWASPRSTGSMSPTEPRGSSLIAEFEDTRRKFSEAMQDPLNMLSKMMGDESSGSPKQGKASSAGDSPASQGSCGREGSTDDTDFKCRRRTDGEHKGSCDTPLRRLQKGSLTKSSASPEQHSHSRDSRLEIQTYGDMIQVVELQSESRGTHRKAFIKSQVSSLPIHWLLPVGLLAYGFFVLPLPSYLTGLSLGVACGFMLGLVVVFIFAPRRSSARDRKSPRFNPNMDPLDGRLTDTEILEGWMNETYSYDPETFHPSVTHSVHVTLEGSRLQLRHPRANIPRWATFKETPCEAVFLRSRSYQLANSKVSLLPPGLARKRVWNKKYPICITLAEGEVGEESVVEGQEEEERAERPTALDPQLPVTLYLFGRTGREKEEWFQHFSSASRATAKNNVDGEENTETPSGGDTAKDSVEELQDLPGAVKPRTLLDYGTFMTQLIGSESGNPTPSPCRSETGSPTTLKKIHNEEQDSEGQAGAECSAGAGAGGGGCSTESQPTWVNSIVGRIFWDFLHEKYWTDQVVHKIQKKLSKIKLPYFMNELTLADLDMGTCLPQVLNTSKPKLDHRGLWLEMELMYTGCLQMTLVTKMNLCKLGREGEDEAHAVPEMHQVGAKPRMCVLADSDEESSSAGSSDEEEVPPFEPQGSLGDKTATVVAADGHTGGSTGRKFLRFVDKIAKSKYFQKATENEYIRKKIAEMSNMPLLLSVEVLELSGTLAINIPPPPTDRIWYSFQEPPRLDLHVRPMLGEREVTLTHVTEWIEKKLQCEFQKVFVMPNMDDLYLPLMTSGLESSPASGHSSVQSTSQQSSMESQEYMSD
ncbi:testis-expressed protein 2-like [Limanda limanda]|uniref:testis-expressed protein 2-like n=1 Tax=Limanda limanda TaxID=27771 RepID=UPI0029C897EB|nr:testis-expressed protein 2-like [Limanda limanda]